MKNFNRHNPDGYRESLPGISQKTLIFGEKTLMSEFVLQAGTSLPQHSHPYEQTGYLVKGYIRLTIGHETHEAHPGDCWCIPMNIPHGADIVDDSIAVEVFSPRRDDYILT